MNDHRLPLSQRVISIRTPENIELSYALAGPGSRAVAYLIDLLLMFVRGADADQPDRGWRSRC